MSYCVNCGVELHKSADHCPLCETVVINPNAVRSGDIPLPFTPNSGPVEAGRQADTAILFTIIFTVPSAACFLINLFVFEQRFWSLYVMGFFAMLWVMIIPPLIFKRIPALLKLTIDAAALIGFIYIVSLQFSNREWYMKIVLPIIVAIAAFALIYSAISSAFSLRRLVKSILILSEIATLSVFIEYIIGMYLTGSFTIRWSIIPLTCCVSVIITLLVMLLSPSLREEAARRFHI